MSTWTADSILLSADGWPPYWTADGYYPSSGYAIRAEMTSTISRRRVNEKSSFVLNVRYYIDGTDPWTPIAPLSAQYQIGMGTYSIVGATTLSVGSTNAITVTSSHNTMISQMFPSEHRQLALIINSGTDNERVYTYDWDVVNLKGIF